MSWNDNVGSNNFPIGLASPEKAPLNLVKMQQKYGKLAIGGRLVGVFFGNAKPVGKLEVGRSRI